MYEPLMSKVATTSLAVEGPWFVTVTITSNGSPTLTGSLGASIVISTSQRSSTKIVLLAEGFPTVT